VVALSRLRGQKNTEISAACDFLWRLCVYLMNSVFCLRSCLTGPDLGGRQTEIILRSLVTFFQLAHLCYMLARGGRESDRLTT
jgi:hypothetical protein